MNKQNIHAGQQNDTVNNTKILMGTLEKNITKTILYVKRLHIKLLAIKERKKLKLNL